MALSTPSTMRSLFVTAYTQPLKYEISELPTPKIEFPDHVLIRVHAASINPVDMAVAGGALKMLVTFPFPYKLGFDLSGTVAGIGDSVKGLAVGDEVFCCLPEQDRGSLSEYALTRASYLVPKPERLSHAEAASIPLVAMTALQAFEKVAGGLTGKNVFVPGGLSGVGSIACQLAKNVLGAAKVITTVSTQKLDKVDEKLGQGTVDQVVSTVIDYKKTNPLKEIPRGSVDVLLETVGSAMTFVRLVGFSRFQYLVLN
ncbi:MAG: hypothetical protein M1818_003578 [Claussenomyces sp. TS43310]|nr:MAG: hypothetical protein M1818_003578 [Claussenomyces sp. TS43310]